MDSFTEVTRQGWGGRLGNSMKGVVVGALMIFGGIALLFWGEGRAVKRAKALDEGSGMVISVDAAAPGAPNEGKLVHFTGVADSFEPLTDQDFGVEVQALKLHRRVEMYQWTEDSETEERKKVGGATERVTTYTYSKKWSSRAVDSSHFNRPDGHQNPGSMPVESRSISADPVVVGDWILGPRFVGKLSQQERLRVGADELRRARTDLADRLQAVDGGFYLGADPSSPQVGDVRIRFAQTPNATISVVGRQRASTLVPYTAKVGGDIALLAYGTQTADEMFQAAKAGNAGLTWILRGLGFLIIMIGFSTVLKPLAVAADVIPFLGNLAERGIGIAAFMLAALVALVTIAIGWIFYRPLLGIVLLIAAGGLITWLWKRATANPGIDRWTGQSPPPPPPA